MGSPPIWLARGGEPRVRVEARGPSLSDISAARPSGIFIAHRDGSEPIPPDRLRTATSRFQDSYTFWKDGALNSTVDGTCL